MIKNLAKKTAYYYTGYRIVRGCAPVVTGAARAFTWGFTNTFVPALEKTIVDTITRGVEKMVYGKEFKRMTDEEYRRILHGIELQDKENKC